MGDTLTFRSRIRVPRPTMRMGAVLLTFMALWSLVAISPALATSARTREPARLGEFMWGLAGQESGWQYYIRNPYSGAFGKYQIMPANWNAWASRYIGDYYADQSRLNQELVGRGKVMGLYDWLGSWRRVAYWWLTGDTDPNSSHWSATAQRYVSNVMSLMDRAPAGGDPLPAAPADGMPIQPNDWRLTTERLPIWDGPGPVHNRIRSVATDRVLQVRRAKYGPRANILWIRVELPDGTLGWLNSRKTLPSKAPKPTHTEG